MADFQACLTFNDSHILDLKIQHNTGKFNSGENLALNPKAQKSLRVSTEAFSRCLSADTMKEHLGTDDGSVRYVRK